VTMLKMPKMPKVKDVDTEIFSAWHSITINNVSRETLKGPFRVALRFEVRG